MHQTGGSTSTKEAYLPLRKAAACAREMLVTADEAFFTGTVAEVTPIRSIDGQAIGSGARGPVTARIQERFFAVARGQAPDTHGWLTPVPG